MSTASPRTAFVLAGGGSLGAVEVGMLEALVEARVRADLVVGSSAGAVNGAFFAGRPDAEGVRALGAIWKGLRARDVFPFSPLGSLLGVFALRDHLVDPAVEEVRAADPHRREDPGDRSAREHGRRRRRSSSAPSGSSSCPPATPAR